jgi:hypothetical protein
VDDILLYIVFQFINLFDLSIYLLYSFKKQNTLKYEKK